MHFNINFVQQMTKLYILLVIKNKLQIVAQKVQRMCGNDISTIIVPNSNDTFLEQLRTQIATGKIIVKNNPNGTKQEIKMNEISMIRRFDTSKIRQIQLIRCDISHELIQQFLKCDFSNLKILSLNNNKIGPIGCRLIASCETLTSLKTLELANNKIKDNGVKALASANFQLEDLNLSDNGLTVQGVKSLKSFQSVQYLSLCGNNLNDQTAQAIKNINSNGFHYLALSRNTFTNNGLREFIPNRKLQVLLLDRNKITAPKSQLQIPPSLFVFY